MKLTVKQKKFADEYIITGNAEQSAIRAGYSVKYARGNAHKLVANGCISDYIKKRFEELDAEKIATMQEVQEFWARVMRNPASEVKDQLKASEYIAKTKGAFIDRQEINAKLTSSDVTINIGVTDADD